MPLDKHNLGTVDELLPILWRLEELIAQNKPVYIFSEGAHGRVGKVADVPLTYSNLDMQA